MAEAVTPSKTITEGEIGKISELVAAKLRRSGLLSALVQEVLRTQGGELAVNLVADLRCRVDAISNFIVRNVTVNRFLTPQAALAATNRMLCLDDEVVATMPKGKGGEVEIVFFRPGHWVNDEGLENEYKRRGLVPVDPFALLAVNAADLTFADKHPNGTYWKDVKGGRWCFVAFYRCPWSDKRRVNVDRDSEWYGHWWFAGCRK